MSSLLTRHKTLFVGLVALVAGGLLTLSAEHAPAALVKGASVIAPTITATPTAQPSVTPTPTVTLTPTPTATLTPTPTHSLAPKQSTIQSTQPTAAQSGLSNDRYYTNVDGDQVNSPTYSNDSSVPAGASALCGDGTYSFSQHRSGTCSHHGGVSQWL